MTSEMNAKQNEVSHLHECGAVLKFPMVQFFLSRRPVMNMDSPALHLGLTDIGRHGK